MENKRRNAFDAGFKLNGIYLSVTEGNRDAACKLDINESKMRLRRRQREELSKCQKTTKAFQGKNEKTRWACLNYVIHVKRFTTVCGTEGNNCGL